MDHDIHTQVVVVGAGNAALSAGVAARERDVDVLVLEKAPRRHRGGNSALTVHMRFPHDGVDDLASLLRGISPEALGRMAEREENYTAAQYYDDIMSVTEGRCDPELARVLVTRAAETVRWMGSQGHTWVPSYANPASANVAAFSGGGYGLQQQWFAAFERRGGTVSYETRAAGLLTDSGGRVTGVRARTPNGEVDIHARAVILACGSFESDPEMRARYLGPEWARVKLRGVPYNSGDGLTMALEIGALPGGSWSDCHASPQDVNRPPFDLPGPGVRGDFWSRYAYPFGITVNLEGDRFMDEGETWRGLTYAKAGRAILSQPEGKAFQIFDHQHQALGLVQGYEAADGFSAATLEALGRKLGISDVPNFARTVGSYNAAVQPGPFDPFSLDGKRAAGIAPPKSNWALPLKTPPFRGYPVGCGLTFTYGGLKITPEARVVHRADRPIPGLFAAGEMVGGLWHRNYPSGAGMMAGSVFGRIAGTNAAEAVRA